MQVGTIVKLKVECLGNKIGTLGVVFYNYGDGFQVIFENGEYDGFSTRRIIENGETEADCFLKEIGFEPLLADYKFKNVMRVSEDFRNEVFDCVLKRKDV